VFGNGLCNAYLVLEEPPPAQAGDRGRDAKLLVLSAHTRAALAAMRAELCEHLLGHPDDAPGDVAFTLHSGRRALAHRVAFGFRDRAELIAGLAGDLGDASEVDADRPPRVIFAFPDGDAAQLAPLARSLRASDAGFRDAHDECVRAAAAAGTALSDAASVVATQIALARTLRGWGVEPAGAHGTGRGAHAAAVIAGTLALGDAMSRADRPGGAPDAIPEGAIVLELGLGAGPGPGIERRAGVPPAPWIAALANATAHGAGRAMIEAAARLWRLGVALDPVGLYRHERRRRIALPTYPFNGARYGWRVTPGRR
jgi:polyketide synthase PksN